jgi:exosome complex RNA-binding protein Rrp42 (RNase PH superfamily)
MINYSENEREFFRKLLFDFEIRIDGREKLSIREYEIIPNVVSSSTSSLKLIYNESQKEILFTIKGELDQNYIPNSPVDKLINVNIDSMYKIEKEDQKLKKELENYLDTFIFSKISTDSFKVQELIYWKIYIDIYVFDTIKLSILQMLAIGVKELIKGIKFPKLISFTNEITHNKEYDLLANYEDISEKENEYQIVVDVPDVYVFSILNNAVFLDPTEEEFSVANSIVLLSTHKGSVLKIQSIGSSVDVQKILDITNMFKSSF